MFSPGSHANKLSWETESKTEIYVVNKYVICELANIFVPLITLSIGGCILAFCHYTA
jgi:hypothetical protein